MPRAWSTRTDLESDFTLLSASPSTSHQLSLCSLFALSLTRADSFGRTYRLFSFDSRFYSSHTFATVFAFLKTITRKKRENRKVYIKETLVGSEPHHNHSHLYALVLLLQFTNSATIPTLFLT